MKNKKSTNNSEISYYRNFSKSKFSKYDLKRRFEIIYDQNYWESGESRSGIGSEINNTKAVVKALKDVIKNYNIRSIVDIPCGDFNWMSTISMKKINYIGLDIVKDVIDINNKQYKKNNINFFWSDITSSELPSSDLMFVRDCLVHLSFDDIKKSVNRIKESQSEYLMSTSFINIKTNLDIYSADWRPINLEKTPFNFPKPIITINEECNEMNGIYSDKSICLWKIKDLPHINI